VASPAVGHDDAGAAGLKARTNLDVEVIIWI
jgi:hypothetical protein